MDEQNGDAARQVIERAYAVFARYPGGPLLDTSGSECTDGSVAREIAEMLEGRPLRLLADEDLKDFFFLAVQHVGELDHFKHYLPRVLELMLFERSSFAPDDLLPRLREMSVETWPIGERELLRDLFHQFPRLLGDFGTPEMVEEWIRVPWTAPDPPLPPSPA